MREIKFRAWSTRLKKHPEYDVFVKKATEEKRIDKNKGTIKQFEDETGNKAFLGEENYMSYDVYVSNKGKSMWLEGGWDYTGDDEKAILMQLTGLKDRKEKEIWEGDVVEYTYETYSGENSVVGVVSFDGEQFGLELSSQWIPIAGKDSEDFEVKGNAYENPNIKVD